MPRPWLPLIAILGRQGFRGYDVDMVEALWRVPVFVWMLGVLCLGGGAWYAHLAARQVPGDGS